MLEFLILGTHDPHCYHIGQNHAPKSSFHHHLSCFNLLCTPCTADSVRHRNCSPALLHILDDDDRVVAHDSRCNFPRDVIGKFRSTLARRITRVHAIATATTKNCTQDDYQIAGNTLRCNVALIPPRKLDWVTHINLI